MIEPLPDFTDLRTISEKFNEMIPIMNALYDADFDFVEMSDSVDVGIDKMNRAMIYFIAAGVENVQCFNPMQSMVEIIHIMNIVIDNVNFETAIQWGWLYERNLKGRGKI
jgi:hypothetical protein